jgi:adenosylmethionine-8-amino-7-oxononanoate aminotransferase
VEKGFFHAHTYSAHPIGCAAALAGIELLNSTEILERRRYIENAHSAFKGLIENHLKVDEVRTLGVVLAIDLNVKMERYGNLRDRLYDFFIERGVLVRPLGNTIYILPPFVITNGQLEKIYDTISAVLETL